MAVDLRTVPVSALPLGADGQPASYAETILAPQIPPQTALSVAFDIDCTGYGGATVLHASGASSGLAGVYEAYYGQDRWITVHGIAIQYNGSAANYVDTASPPGTSNSSTNPRLFCLAGALRFRYRVTLISSGYVAPIVTLIPGYVPPLGQYVETRVPSGNTWVYAAATGGITNTTALSFKASAGTGAKNYLTGLQFINVAAVASEIVVKDSGGDLWRGYAPASMTRETVVTFSPAITGATAAAMQVQMATTATQTYFSAQGYVGA